MFRFLTGVGVGILLCHPEAVTKIILDVKEKQADAKRELVENSKIIEADLQAFLKNNPPKKNKEK